MDAIPTIKTKIKKKRPIALPNRNKKKKKSIGKGGTSITIGSSVVTSPKRKDDREEIKESDEVNNIGTTTDDNSKEKERDGNVPNEIVATEIVTRTTAISQRLPWELDPKWNIEKPKEGQKTMADFCRSYKPPPPEKDEKGNVINNTSSSILKARRERAAEARAKQGETNIQEEQEDAAAGPQVQVINGEIVIQESSLLLHQHKTIEQLDEELGGTEVVEDSTLLTATYASFKKPHARRKKWPPEDVYDLYSAIRSYGPDFSLIETFFKNRYTRKEIRIKFKKELRDNEKLMDMALYGGGNSNGAKLDIPMSVTTNTNNDHEIKETENEEDKPEEPEVVIEEQEEEEEPKHLSLEEKYANLFDEEPEPKETQHEAMTQETNTVYTDDFDSTYHEEQSQHTANTNTSLSILGSVKKSNKKKKNKFKIKKKK